MKPRDLEGKVALITGANNPHGIGAEVARVLAAEGVRVFLAYKRMTPDGYGLSEETVKAARQPGLPYYHAQRMKSAAEVVEAIVAAGGQAAHLEIDLTLPDSANTVFEAAEAALGPINILVNNAAYYVNEDSILTITAETLEQTFTVNTLVPVLLAAELVRRHVRRKARSGRIINLSTDAAQVFAGQISYGASKAAVEAFTRSIAMEVGPLGITVNAIAPGPTQSGYISAEFEERLKGAIPMGRIGQPRDIADAVAFLVSDQAEWITGQVIKVSGGHAL